MTGARTGHARTMGERVISEDMTPCDGFLLAERRGKKVRQKEVESIKKNGYKDHR